jgi:Rrf2 family protein
MQVILGARGDYAVRAVLYLARHPGRQRRRSISGAMGIPDTYLSQILGALVRAGIARSVTGRAGGYELARVPGAISLREVVEVTEGPLQQRRCILRNGPCYWGDKCAVHDAWREAEAALGDRLARTTFEDLALADWELEQRTARVPPAGP